ncbi:MAG: SDR family oxidoreductase [Candidatus Krumholzibacteria bacterium]|jgi:NAD(P)-dependent dehydrogenase (short-subunit alcohol dehydrogenase family)|nr:SDR family oxidoreductase [Candidatus Krumholzibacteria bacterium]MDP6669002.1 SDR family oxidoreductase [Candidatus Krumholzibacteria bacterium]MDP6797393.1 SDR family oxidoreductase [Candidatus Krumholzibacteria bacterium]MDP7021092.1 SDR family oxidoreductase [Candidatus Krumholzibacteria bacterium]
MENRLKNSWALILGASSGFGAAAARALSREACHIVGIHLDRKATMPLVHELVADIEKQGVEAHFFNINASSEDKRGEVIRSLKEQGVGQIRVLMHSLAFGTLLPFFPKDPEEAAMRRDRMEMTLDVMAHSLVYWAQDLYRAGLLGKGSRVFAMTSSGSARVIPAYGAVSAAKCALESHIRQIASELGAIGVTANSIRAGVTDTPALRMIPGNENLLEKARQHNPAGRLTEPEDIAELIVSLCGPAGDWVSGNVIGADGGEDIVG